jgi:hypothetical protein
MLSISDARFLDALAAEAKSHGKLTADFRIPEAWRQHRPECLREALDPLVRKDLLPTFPFGSEFTEVEQQLLPALNWLKSSSSNWRGKLGLLAALVRAGEPVADESTALQRMKLAAPTSFAERLQQRLLQVALRRTAAEA